MRAKLLVASLLLLILCVGGVVVAGDIFESDTEKWKIELEKEALFDTADEQDDSPVGKIKKSIIQFFLRDLKNWRKNALEKISKHSSLHIVEKSSESQQVKPQKSAPIQTEPSKKQPKNNTGKHQPKKQPTKVNNQPPKSSPNPKDITPIPAYNKSCFRTCFQHNDPCQCQRDTRTFKLNCPRSCHYTKKSFTILKNKCISYCSEHSVYDPEDDSIPPLVYEAKSPSKQNTNNSSNPTSQPVSTPNPTPKPEDEDEEDEEESGAIIPLNPSTTESTSGSQTKPSSTSTESKQQTQLTPEQIKKMDKVIEDLVNRIRIRW